MRIMLRKLLPEMFGGKRNNCWNALFDRTVGRWRSERAERPFMELIARETRPFRILEIGVERGWGAERMVKAAGAENGRNVEYYGVDLDFKSASMEKIQSRLEKLGVSKVRLFKGDSREVLPIIVPILPKMDLVYIDGGHEPPVSKSDWENVQPLRHEDTVVVFDDYEMEGVKHVVDGIKGFKIEILDCPIVKAIVTCLGDPA